jgi:aryl-alcohol dehydrogenase-like predicted oxidoreductase
MKHILISGVDQGCSQIVLGTSLFTPERKDVIFEILDKYVEHGGNTIDTSRIYSIGKSEIVLSMWLKSRGNRKDIVIINKGGHHYIDDKGIHHPERRRVRPEMITEDLMKSLDTMEVDFFDIYLIHRDDPMVPVGELIDMLQEHKDAGYIKAYGVSNWSAQRIEEANQYATSKGYSGVVINSPSLSLAQANEPRWTGCTYVDNEYIRWHEQSQIPVLSWAPQASGFFFGIHKDASLFKPDVARVYYSDANLERFNRANQLAKEKGEQFTANDIALAYVLNQQFPICAVIGPQKAEELLSSFRAVDIQLSNEERLWINFQLD